MGFIMDFFFFFIIYHILLQTTDIISQTTRRTKLIYIHKTNYSLYCTVFIIVKCNNPTRFTANSYKVNILQVCGYSTLLMPLVELRTYTANDIQ